MRVKIGNTWYDAVDTAICLELDDGDKKRILEMTEGGTKWASFPDDLAAQMTREQMFAWMDAE